MEDKKILVIKVGSSTLTRGSQMISRGKIEDLARQFAILKDKYKIVLVSSGAVAAAKQHLNWAVQKTQEVAHKQALSAIGQPILMKIYQEVFQDYNLHVAQCLLTYYDFRNEVNRTNILSTIHSLWESDFIPIINENDTVATQEIRFGDNDKLAGKVASLIGADLCILVSDIDGLYTADPRVDEKAEFIYEVDEIDNVRHLAGDSVSGLGSGGMKSKIDAAEICMHDNIEMWIINGDSESFVTQAIDKKIPFTSFKK